MRLFVLHPRALPAALVCAMTLPSAAVRAQQPRPAYVRVLVTDAADTPVHGAQVFFLRNGESVRMGVADSAGVVTFRLTVEHAGYGVMARAIGYRPESAAVAPRAGDTVTVALSLAAAPAELDTVRASAENLPSTDYYLGSAEIMATHRVVDNAWDALNKLRPAMLGDTYRTCPMLQYIWINGKRVWSDAAEEANGASALSDSVILWDVHKEHIAEMRYVNCWDWSDPRLGADNALFITLKPGVDWDYKWGSYVVDSALYLASEHPDSTARRTPPDAPAAPAAAPPAAAPVVAAPRRAVPQRIVGVYDAETGDPLPGVLIRDTLTGVSATTSNTGTAVLSLLSPPTAVLVVHKSGFVDQSLQIAVSPSDTLPITVVLERVPKP